MRFSRSIFVLTILFSGAAEATIANLKCSAISPIDNTPIYLLISEDEKKVQKDRTALGLSLREYTLKYSGPDFNLPNTKVYRFSDTLPNGKNRYFRLAVDGEPGTVQVARFYDNDDHKFEPLEMRCEQTSEAFR